MQTEKEGRRSPLSDQSSSSNSGSNSSMSGDNNNSSSDSWMLLPGANAAADVDGEEEIERPRLEDSRASLALQLPPELALLVPSQSKSRQLRPQDPLLSSTMVQDPAGLSLSLSLAAQDWPNASSIRLGNSNSGNWGHVANSAAEDSPSDRLNNADICLDASSAEVPAPSVSASTAAVAAASARATAAGNATSEAVSVSDFDTDSSASASSASASTNPDVSSPRLRVLASDGGQHRPDEDQAQQQPPLQQQQLALDLLQVCRLTLDVLSEGGLLRDDARGWLTPELLCDKLCDRIYCPLQQPQASAAAAAPSADSSIAAPTELESPVGRVRHWLLADGGGGGVGGGGGGGSPLRRRNLTNSV